MRRDGRHAPPRLGRVAVAAGLAAVGLVAAGVPQGVGAQEATTEPESVVLFIIDLSGSMNEDFGDGRTKLEVAKEAFSEAFSNVPDDAAIGLRVYGDQLQAQAPAARQENCENDTRLAVPIGTGNRDTILQEVDGFQARGDTPISLALQATARGDIPEDALATVVLFSDGRDECFDADLDGDAASGPSWGPDPCEVAKEIAGEGVDLRIDRIETLGFQAGDAESQLRCIAESTGGTFHPIETPEDASEVIGDLSTPREAVRLGGEPIEGTPGMQGAPDLARIAPGEADRRYTDTIAVNEERWYRIAEYGPGPGNTTVTVFGLPEVEGTTLELRMEPGPEENISGGLTETREDAGVPRAPSTSVRCGGCEVRSDESHELFWVVALRSDEPSVAAQGYDLELLLEGTGWGGPASGCTEGMTCWFEAQIDAAEARRAELQDRLGDDDTEALDEEIEDLEAELASLTTRREALEDGGSSGTSWLLPGLLALVGLGAGTGWLIESRRGRPEPAAAGATGPVSTAVVGTIDLGSPGPMSEGEPASSEPGPGPEPAPEPMSVSPEPGSTSTGGDGTEPAPAAAGTGPADTEEGREVPPDSDQATTSATGDAITAGWYQDPVDPGLLRWWDGAAWTDQTHRKA